MTVQTITGPLNKEWVINQRAPWSALAYAHAGGTDPMVRGRLRVNAEDFVADEELGFAPDGEGEHQLLQIRKRNLNTMDVARALARYAGIQVRDVGYCGLKDRQALATQWFSIRPAREIDWSEFSSENLKILTVQQHKRKLRRGSHRGNRFRILVRDLVGPLQALESRLQQIQRSGAPNYFGEQRFGRDGNNLSRADGMFAHRFRVRDRQQRSLYLSAARSWMFNCVLSQRVTAGSWNSLLAGDVAGLQGSNSFFPVPQLDSDLTRRVEEGDIHPTGPLPGKGELLTDGAPLAIEQEVFVKYEPWYRGLAEAGLCQERRSLRLLVPDLSWRLEETELQMEFTLPRGAFATSVLRECVNYKSE